MLSQQKAQLDWTEREHLDNLLMAKDTIRIESTPSSIRQRRRRCNDRDAATDQERNSPRPDCSWSSGSMTWGSSLPGLLTRVEIS